MLPSNRIQVGNLLIEDEWWLSSMSEHPVFTVTFNTFIKELNIQSAMHFIELCTWGNACKRGLEYRVPGRWFSLGNCIGVVGSFLNFEPLL